MPTISPSVAITRALKLALRRHPAGPRGAAVSNMSRPELTKIALELGLDVDQIARDAVADDAPTEEAPMVEATSETETAVAGSTLTQAEIEDQVSAIRGLIVTGGFAAMDDRLRELVRDASKPPVVQTITETVTVTVDAAGVPSAPAITQARCLGVDKTWKDLFGLKGTIGTRTTKLWDGAHPDTPKSNRDYIFPATQTAIVLTQLSRGRNAYLYGPPGTGKTEFASELAARTGRPFALLSCDNATDGPTLVGMTVPKAGGGTTWQDGLLTRAIQTPGCVVCIDEPSVARPGALFVMQNMLANRVLYIQETGRRVPVANGVLFVACDNTNGTGGGGRKGLTDTNQMNAAFMDRFGPRARFAYLDKPAEIKILCAYTRCTPELAELLVDAAAVTRAAEENAQVTMGLSFRRLLAWAELLTDGIEPEAAFNAAVLDCMKEQDREAVRQQCMLAYDRGAVARALNPPTVTTTAPVAADPADTNPTGAGRDAAEDFA